MTEAAPLPPETSVPTVSLAEFKRIDLRTAKILAVSEHPRADRLWVLTIDTGGGKTKEIVAGIRAHYTADTLVGKTIVIVNNLEPAVIRGVNSCGMLLAAKDGENLAVLTPDKALAAGLAIG